jgi:hypothetical protein
LYRSGEADPSDNFAALQADLAALQANLKVRLYGALQADLKVRLYGVRLYGV